MAHPSLLSPSNSSRSSYNNNNNGSLGGSGSGSGSSLRLLQRRRFGWFVIGTILVVSNINSMKQISMSIVQFPQTTTTTTVSSKRYTEDEDATTKTTTTTMITTDNNNSNNNNNNKYPINDGNVIGILSTQPQSYFQKLRNQIDYETNNVERCQRYGWTYKGPSEFETSGLPPILQRKIYFGSLIANEPWELYEIISTETHSIYEGIVFVESNRTQNLTPRNLTKVSQQYTTKPILQQLFNTSNIQLRQFVNEDRKVKDLMREHAQRNEILKGWADIGMKPNDIGIVADLDECQTRDFLRALQICDDIDSFNYKKYNCEMGKVGIRGRGEVYESSPECITKDRKHWRPIIHIGHCIDYIGNTTVHIKSQYNGRNRAIGYGGGKQLNLTVTNGSIPIFTAIDFRTGGSGYWPITKQQGFGTQTGYHFHNFFTSIYDLRYKYYTYGHPQKDAMNQTAIKIETLANDVSVAVHCARNISDPDTAKWKRVVGGFHKLQPFQPIYFHDPIYRQKRHEFLKQLIQQEDDNANDNKMRMMMTMNSVNSSTNS